MKSYKETDIQVGDILVYEGIPRWEIIRWDSGVNTIKDLRDGGLSSGHYKNILSPLNDYPQYYTLIKPKSRNFNLLYEKLNGH